MVFSHQAGNSLISTCLVSHSITRSDKVLDIMMMCASFFKASSELGEEVCHSRVYNISISTSFFIMVGRGDASARLEVPRHRVRNLLGH